MADKAFTAQDLLMNMLETGWEWTKSNQPGYVALKRGNFVWFVDSTNMNFYDLLGAMLKESYEHGREEGFTHGTKTGNKISKQYGSASFEEAKECSALSNPTTGTRR